jgi:hypothetical protein
MAIVQALKTNNAALVERWLNKQGTELIRQIFFGFQTASIVRRFGGVKKTLDIGVFNKDKKIVRGWSKDFAPKGDEFSYDKLTLSVGKKKVELEMTYLEEQVEAFDAYLEGTGEATSSMSDEAYGTKFMAWLMSEAAQGIDEEFEEATWMAIKDATAPADADLIRTFDGYRRQAATICAAAASVVNTGAIDQTNAVTKVETFFRGFDKRIQASGAMIGCTYNLFNDYKIHYRDMHKQNALVETFAGTNFEAIPIYLGGKKTYLMPFAGMGDDDALVGTRPEWMAMGYEDIGAWDVQKHGWQLWALKAMRFGITYLQQRKGYLIANDRLISIESTRTVA